MSEAERRSDNSGLWFSPEPEPPKVTGARRHDSVLFEISKVPAIVNVSAPTRWRGGVKSTGSGLIDVRTLVDLSRDPANSPQPLSVSHLLTPRLMPPHLIAAPPTPAPSTPRPLLLAIVGLLGALVAMLAMLAVR